MEEHPFTVLHFAPNKTKKNQVKQAVVEKKWIAHLEKEGYAITAFEADQEQSKITFTYQDMTFVFHVDLVVDTLFVDFEGQGYSDKQRLQASRLLERLIESLRFCHKDKYWSLSHYYISDEVAYEERKKNEFPAHYQKEWVRMANQAKYEPMDEDDLLLMEIEEVRDVKLKIVGEDGLVLCTYLQSIGLIGYECTQVNEYTIEFVETLDEMSTINRKLIFARELAFYGYNTWVDYTE